LTQAALGVFACYPIDHPIPSGTLYQTFLKVTSMHPKLYDCNMHCSYYMRVCHLI